MWKSTPSSGDRLSLVCWKLNFISLADFNKAVAKVKLKFDAGQHLIYSDCVDAEPKIHFGMKSANSKMTLQINI
jgi:hypothetical protein